MCTTRVHPNFLPHMQIPPRDEDGAVAEEVAHTVERGAGFDGTGCRGMPQCMGVDTREGGGFTDAPQDVVDARDGQPPRRLPEGQKERLPIPRSHSHRPLVGAEGDGRLPGERHEPQLLSLAGDAEDGPGRFESDVPDGEATDLPGPQPPDPEADEDRQVPLPLVGPPVGSVQQPLQLPVRQDTGGETSRPLRSPEAGGHILRQDPLLVGTSEKRRRYSRPPADGSRRQPPPAHVLHIPLAAAHLGPRQPVEESSDLPFIRLPCRPGVAAEEEEGLCLMQVKNLLHGSPPGW